MEFDKSKIYTAVNADELKVGSKCYFADDIKSLEKQVHDEFDVDVFDNLMESSEKERFKAKSGCTYTLAYLIEPPKEKEFKPFSSVEKAVEEIKKHGGWVKAYGKEFRGVYALTAYSLKDVDGIYIHKDWHNCKELFENFIFADDGTPCGELVEENLKED